MNTQQQIEDYKRRIADLERQQKDCTHTWSAAKYDPETKKAYSIDYSREPEVHGIHRDYHLCSIDTTIPRWSRECTKCGFKQYTYKEETVEVRKEPKF